MGINHFAGGGKALNRLNPLKNSMRKGPSRKVKEELSASIKEAQQDPEFFKEINRFIKATKSVYKLY